MHIQSHPVVTVVCVSSILDTFHKTSLRHCLCNNIIAYKDIKKKKSKKKKEKHCPFVFIHYLPLLMALILSKYEFPSDIIFLLLKDFSFGISDHMNCWQPILLTLCLKVCSFSLHFWKAFRNTGCLVSFFFSGKFCPPLLSRRFLMRSQLCPEFSPACHFCALSLPSRLLAVCGFQRLEADAL